MSKRAERRHHYQRLKKKVKWNYGGKYTRHGGYEPWDDDRCGSMVETRPDCSCSSCGNPRRKELRPELQYTIQERKNNQDDIDDMINEYYLEKDEETS